MTGPAAILIGPPGAGKSTVGPLLADLLGVGFADTDDRVEAVAGKPVSDIFISEGEAAFRALERAAVASALADHRGVLGLGGGAVMDPRTQAILNGQRVVYLETGFADAAKRVGLDQPRPLLLGNPRAQLRALLEQRLPVYQRLAWITVSTGGRLPGEIAAEVAVRLGRRPEHAPEHAPEQGPEQGPEHAPERGPAGGHGTGAAAGAAPPRTERPGPAR